MYKFNTYICKKFGGINNIYSVEISRQKLLKNQLRIKVLAIGLSYIDVLMIKGTYQHKILPPFIPGNEVCGIIIEEKCDNKNLLQKKVIVNKKGGCFAEELIAHKEDIIIIPDCIKSSIAAGLFTSYLTGYTSIIKLGGIKFGENVLVTGASGAVGIACLNILEDLKANSIAVTSNIKKANFISKFTTENILIYDKFKKDNFSKYKNNIHVILDINGLLKTENILSSLKWGGKYIIIGFIDKNITKISTNYILIKGLQIIGIRAGQYLKQNKKIRPIIIKRVLNYLKKKNNQYFISESLPFSELKKGLFKLTNRKSMGKIIIKTRYFHE